MEAGYFLDIADNTEDEFSYEILPVDVANKIPKHYNQITLIRSVVRSWEIDLTHSPSCVESQTGFEFYNRSDDELFGTERINIVPKV